ncbi:hypothetical protein ACJX0J_039487 [Zea mays]
MMLEKVSFEGKRIKYELEFVKNHYFLHKKRRAHLDDSTRSTSLNEKVSTDTWVNELTKCWRAAATQQILYAYLVRIVCTVNYMILFVLTFMSYGRTFGNFDNNAHKCQHDNSESMNHHKCVETFFLSNTPRSTERATKKLE